MTDRYSRLQHAVFQRFESCTSWSVLANTFSLSESTIRRSYKTWIAEPPESQPLLPSDIHIPERGPGRPHALSDSEEKIIFDAINYFAMHNTPLTKVGSQDLVQHYVEMLPASRRAEIGFKNSRPSFSWVTDFIHRHNLAYKSVRVTEDKTVQAVTEENIAEHIARLKAAMSRNNISDGRYVFNMDQSGASFAKMTGRSLRKGIGPRNVALIHAAIRTKGNLERVTVMPVVSAAGTPYTPVIVFPRKQAYFRRVNGHVQTLNSFLPPC